MRVDARHRWSVASRALAAIAGGYALATLVTLALSLLLPVAGMQHAPALLGASMASFLVWTAIIMVVFHVRSATRAWIWLAGAALPLGLIVWLLLPEAGA